MSDKSNNPFRFWQELKRRKVIRFIPVYAAASFVILELVDIIAEPFGLPDWTLKLVVVLLSIGFIISIILTWVYDITPEGVQKTKPISKVTKQQKETGSKMIGWKITSYVSIVIIIGLLMFNIFGSRKQAEDFTELEKSIAVLPFYYYNMNKEAKDVGDAFANEIITQLYKIRGFDKIISHTSTLQYKGHKRLSIPEIGKELGVNFIIEGSLERQHEDVSVQIQIIRAVKDDHIWADEFRGKWEDVFEIRARIAKKVASVLSTILTPQEILQVEKRPTGDIDAYDLYLLAGQFYNNSTEENLLRAIDLYESAIHLDPDFAKAYVGIADSYMDLFWNANWLPEKAYLKAREATLKALELDPDLSEAHAAMAYVKLYSDWNMEEAEAEFRKAIALNPNSSTAHSRYSSFLNVTGRTKECHEHAKRAVELDPNNKEHQIWYGYTFHQIGQTDSAITYIRKRIKLHPYVAEAYYLLGYIYIDIESFDVAIKELETAVGLFSGPQPYYLYLGMAYARNCMPEKAREQLEKLDELEKENQVVSFGKAILLAELGETEQALYWLEKAYEERNQYILYIKSFPVMFASIRSDPRFIEIYNKVWPSK